MPDYSKGKIYEIKSSYFEKNYIGSTTQDLKKRLYNHKVEYKKWKENKGRYMSSFEILKYSDYQIQLIENYPCSSRYELEKRETEIIQINNCCNKKLPQVIQQKYTYENGKIYCLKSNKTDKVYIGSTIGELEKRMYKHRHEYKKWNGIELRTTAFQIFEYGDVYIELVEKYPCKNKEELEKREGEIIRNTQNCINRRKMLDEETFKKNRNLRAKEYREKNKEKIKNKEKLYRETNREKIRENDKKYRKKNNDKLNEQNRKRYHANQERYKEQRKKYREKNIEQLNEKSKKYREENIEKIKKREKKYRQEHQDEIKKRKKEYYFKNKDKIKDNVNKDKIKEQKKKYRERHKEEIKKYDKEYRNNNRDIINENKMKYYFKNRDIINEKRREKRFENREKINQKKMESYHRNKHKLLEKMQCLCGKEIAKCSLNRHLKTKFHLQNC